jgi:hypothetical protein
MRSLVGSTQTPPQLTCPEGQDVVQTPEAQTCPVGQTLPTVPGAGLMLSQSPDAPQ